MIFQIISSFRMIVFFIWSNLNQASAQKLFLFIYLSSFVICLHDKDLQKAYRFINKP